MAERHYWNVMTYRCDHCGFELEFFLEDGCEGPRDHQAPIPPEWEERRARAPKVVRDRLPDTVPQTASGRFVLPVPFIAAPCPKCQPGPGPHDLGAGILQHVNWSQDRMVSTTEPPAGVGLFHYPDDWAADGACGHPVLPEEAPKRP